MSATQRSASGRGRRGSVHCGRCHVLSGRCNAHELATTLLSSHLSSATPTSSAASARLIIEQSPLEVLLWRPHVRLLLLLLHVLVAVVVLLLVLLGCCVLLLLEVLHHQHLLLAVRVGKMSVRRIVAGSSGRHVIVVVKRLWSHTEVVVATRWWHGRRRHIHLARLVLIHSRTNGHLAVGCERLLWLLLRLALLLLLLLVVSEALILATLFVPLLVLGRWRYPVSTTQSSGE